MDSDGWDASDDPRAMIRAVGDRVSPRKWRLFAAASTRDATRHHPLPAVVDAVSLAERYSDGLVASQRMVAARQAAVRGWGDTQLRLLLDPCDFTFNEAIAWTIGTSRIGPDPNRPLLWLCEVIGNPFRWVRWEDEWVTRTVHAVAAPAYAEGRFDTLPVLADALEDAGCDNDELLAHLRGPGPHVRGCWALDVVLGKV